MKKNIAIVAEHDEYTGTVTFADINEMLRKADPKNVTYQLAGQLASTELAMEAGYLSDDMLIFAPSLTRFLYDAGGGQLAGMMSPSGIITLGALTDAIISELRVTSLCRRTG